MKTILIPDHLADNTEIEKTILGDEHRIITYAFQEGDTIPDEEWEKCDGVLVWHHLEINSKIISKMEKCKFIIRVGAGYDNVDVVAARTKNIIVCNIPDYGTNDVADHAIGLILSLARGINIFNDKVKNGNAWQWESAGELFRLTGARLGIIGLGRIGTATALRGKAFGMDVNYYDPFIANGMDKALMLKRYSNLEELLKISDIISIHTPLTAKTKLMANKDFFFKMKKVK